MAQSPIVVHAQREAIGLRDKAPLLDLHLLFPPPGLPPDTATPVRQTAVTCPTVIPNPFDSTYTLHYTYSVPVSLPFP